MYENLFATLILRWKNFPKLPRNVNKIMPLYRNILLNLFMKKMTFVLHGFYVVFIDQNRYHFSLKRDVLHS
jgi:hypothetical protein